MSEFTAQLFVAQPTVDVASRLRTEGVSGVVFPCRQGSAIIAPWEDWGTLEAAFPEVWTVSYAEDYGLLDINGWRNGQHWLSFQLNGKNADELDELLDEDGLYPDGSPGPEQARNQSRESVTLAAEAGLLTPELSAWMLRALKRRFSARYVLRLLPPRLGFGVLRWLGPEDLDHRTQQEWLSDYPQAIIVN